MPDDDAPTNLPFNRITLAAALLLGGYTFGPIEFEGSTVVCVLPASRIDTLATT